MRNNPHLYELNLAAWLSELSGREKRAVTLADIPAQEVRRVREMGMDALWLMGVWERSPYSAERARKVESIVEECKNILPDFDPGQIDGSPYAVRYYRPEPRFGSFDHLTRLGERLKNQGLSLVLDFVPNHTACDHPWVEERPGLYITIPEGQDGSCREGFFPSRFGEKGICIAHGRDPYFPPWTDTAQLNYMEPGTPESMTQVLSEVACCCDGVRCDMAMLVLGSVFRETWKAYLVGKNSDAEEFWPKATDSVKEKKPGFFFIAEAYWGLEKDLLSAGFDYAYDKEFYDLLRDGNIEGLRNHLARPVADQERSVRFIENHDEPRAMQVFGSRRICSAMVIHATVPGMKMWHHGQLEGRKYSIPVQLMVWPQEKPDTMVRRFSERLLGEVDHPIFHEGMWEMCGIDGWLDNDTGKNLLAWTWRLGAERRLIVVNFTPFPSQGRIRPSAAWTRGLDSVRLYDSLNGEGWERNGAEIREKGLYVCLEGYRFHFFKIEEK